MRQYVQIRFNPWDKRTYTYHNDGAPVVVGDKVNVTTQDGQQAVEVMGLIDDRPVFQTKAIDGKAAADD